MTPATRPAYVARVIDGDTIEPGRGIRVRLIGVDTPEMFFGVECFGPEASAFTERHLQRPGQIRDENGSEVVCLGNPGTQNNW